MCVLEQVCREGDLVHLLHVVSVLPRSRHDCLLVAWFASYRCGACYPSSPYSTAVGFLNMHLRAALSARQCMVTPPTPVHFAVRGSLSCWPYALCCMASLIALARHQHMSHTRTLIAGPLRIHRHSRTDDGAERGGAGRSGDAIRSGQHTR